MTWRMLVTSILHNIDKLDEQAVVRMLRREPELNTVTEVKLIPVARVSMTNLIVEEEDVKYLSWIKG